MTPQDLAQLLMVGVPDNNDLSHLRELSPGGVVLFGRNAGTPQEVRRLTRQINDAVSQSGAPLPLIAIDQEGGRVQRLTDGFTTIPPMRELAQSGAGAVRLMAANVAAELRAVGINVNFAPVCDVPTHKEDTIIGNRAFATDAITAASLAAEYVRGAQPTVLCVAKHFPGHGNVGVDSHLALPTDSSTRKELGEQLLPFRATIGAGIGGVMTGHIALPNVDQSGAPASLSREIVTNILRRQLNFGGLVFTDDLDMKALPQNDPAEIAVRALQAGSDQLLFCHDIQKAFAARDAIMQAIENRVLAASQIGASLARIANVKATFVA